MLFFYSFFTMGIRYCVVLVVSVLTARFLVSRHPYYKLMIPSFLFLFGKLDLKLM